jgi:hypothetical protein
MRIHYRASTPLLTLRGSSGIQDRLTPTTGVASNRIRTSRCAARRPNRFMVPHGFRLVRRPSSLVHRTAAAHLRLARTRVVRTALFWDGRCAGIISHPTADRDMGVRRWAARCPIPSFALACASTPPPPASLRWRIKSSPH